MALQVSDYLSPRLQSKCQSTRVGLICQLHGPTFQLQVDWELASVPSQGRSSALRLHVKLNVVGILVT